MNKRQSNVTKEFQYYGIILLSALDLVAIIGFAMLGLLSTIKTGDSTPSFQSFGGVTPATTFNIYSIHPIIWFILCGSNISVYPWLVKTRQTLRDEVEYNEFGVNKKRGNFSQLSKKEREAIEKQKMMDAERILDAPTLKKITHEGVAKPEQELNKLIGLDNVKADIRQMEARMRYEQSVREDNKKEKKREREKSTTDTLSTMHMIFKGAPGTGKTTIARIMASLLFQYGYIQKNQCVEIDGNFFNGLSTGESSKRATMLIEKSRGCVIFIDEAYALLSGTRGQEVIATIVKAMEDYRDELVFIFAGYEHEMQEFIDSNPGIESRVKWHMTFHNYSVSEMKRIFKFMANEKGLLVSQELLDKAANELYRLSMQPNFGNARTVRNLLDKIIDKHAMNLMNGTLGEDAKYRLMSSDMI